MKEFCQYSEKCSISLETLDTVEAGTMGGSMRGAQQSPSVTQKRLAGALRAISLLNGRRQAGKKGLEKEQVEKKNQYIPSFSKLSSSPE